MRVHLTIYTTTPGLDGFICCRKVIGKKGCPGRPVISECGTCTEKSFWTPIYIKRLVPEISSYIRDTKHFLQMLLYLGRLPEGTISGCSGAISSYSP